jgi:hypothetical protein
MAHRGQRSEHEARGVLSAWRKSGQSLERFAKERGLVPQRIRWWKAKLEDKSTALVRSESPLALWPVQVTERYSFSPSGGSPSVSCSSSFAAFSS